MFSPTILNLSLLEMASLYIPSTCLDFVKSFFSICPEKSLAPIVMIDEIMVLVWHFLNYCCHILPS